MTYTLALAALADPTRRAVFESLRRGPASVGTIAAGLPVSRPAVSQHLKALKDAKLVADRAQGTRRMYSIDPDGLGELRRWLDRFWTDALASFKEEVERAGRNRGEGT
jgi:DNA-binding transcriptional ArsR family regulator